MSRKRIRELEQKLRDGFKDQFPCAPEFFSWSSDTVDLSRVDAKALGLEINRHMVDKFKRGEFYRMDTPFPLKSQVAGGDIEVKVLSKTIRDMQQEVERLAMQRRSPFPGISNN